jgi:PD-(D/E)XK nuclease superfamily
VEEVINREKQHRIQIPSKWDIIPVHNSDRATFKFCRRQWAWSSPSRGNLIRRASIHGIYEPFWFGAGIHYALQKYYDPALREDPVTVWLTWFDLQWHGGTLTLENDPKEFADREPTVTEDGTIHVDGLKDVLPFADEAETVEKFMNYRDLGRGMMEFYKSWSEINDNFDVVAVEHDFSIPILAPDGSPLYAVDTRPMPDDWEPNFDLGNSYGPLIKIEGGIPVKQVHARGRMDLIKQEREHGRYGIQDYKTTAAINEDYFRHLELDEQSSTYLFSGEVEARMFDLPYKKLEFIDYVAIFKGYPKPPTITSRGVPSLDRQKEMTSVRLFEQTIDLIPGGRIWFENDEKAKRYYSWLLEMGDKRYIWPERAWRNNTQRANVGLRMYYEALDMLDPDVKLYPNPTKNFSCLNCIFRAPCIAAEDGSDYKAIIEEGYIPNWDR